jgi:DNA-binding transcriptional regulator YiaG
VFLAVLILYKNGTVKSNTNTVKHKHLYQNGKGTVSKWYSVYNFKGADMRIKKNENYAEFISRIRQKTKYTQRELAELMGFEVTIVNLWENGRQIPSMKSQRIIDEFAKSVK